MRDPLGSVLLVSLVVASLCTTAFPVMYSRCPWNSTVLGRALMAMSTSGAVAVDLAFVYSLWTPSDVRLSSVTAILISSALSMSSAYLTLVMWRINHQSIPEKETSS